MPLPPRRPPSSTVPLAAVYTVLVLYASLYPGTGWRWPPGLDLPELLRLPWPPWIDDFDIWSNLAGYLPLGALLTVAARRSGWRTLPAVALALLLAAALSWSCEVLQQFLPGRHPSLKDLAANVGGAAAGTVLALAGQALGLDDRWHSLRQRWFASDGAWAMALLALWPLGLLFPAPAPLGLGQIGPWLRATALDWTAGVPWAAELHELLAGTLADSASAGGVVGAAARGAAAAAARLPPLGEGVITALGLLAPVLLAYAVMAPGLRRIAALLVLVGLAVTGMTLSTWLNFGPQHALTWLAPSTLPALAAATLLAAALTVVPRRLAAALGLVVMTGLVAAVAQAPADPYFAHNLRAWQQGEFVRFHGLSQWLGWLWPWAALAWLIGRTAGRSAGPTARGGSLQSHG